MVGGNAFFVKRITRATKLNELRSRIDSAISENEAALRYWLSLYEARLEICSSEIESFWIDFKEKHSLIQQCCLLEVLYSRDIPLSRFAAAWKTTNHLALAVHKVWKGAEDAHLTKTLTLN